MLDMSCMSCSITGSSLTLVPAPLITTRKSTACTADLLNDVLKTLLKGTLDVLLNLAQYMCSMLDTKSILNMILSPC